MGRLADVVFLIVIVVGVVLLVGHLAGGGRTSAARVERARRQARWRVDDTGTTEDGRAVMRIKLVSRGVAEPYGSHDIGEPYDLGDDLAWVERRGLADTLASALNDRLDHEQNIRE